MLINSQESIYFFYEPYYNINDTDIYISNGIGESLINIRFNSTPSINFYRLNKK